MAAAFGEADPTGQRGCVVGATQTRALPFRACAPRDLGRLCRAETAQEPGLAVEPIGMRVRPRQASAAWAGPSPQAFVPAIGRRPPSAPARGATLSSSGAVLILAIVGCLA